MKKTISILALFILFSSTIFAQKRPNDIIFIIDELRTSWDIEALKMETYEGMKDYCHSKSYRKEVSHLLSQIHHYDTTLYFTVNEKYNAGEDLAAKETLDDIILLETKYTNQKFVSFLKKECDKVIHIEKNMARKGSGGFDKDIAALEEELVLYIDAVTERVDLVDEHIHHLKALDPNAIQPKKEKSEGTGF
ncbi:hypothetical protein N7E81_13770 [Reichenbachiella carrageenanivorans]|uniref:Uncharacterized protein n=1 Tax=Reichenbachiella carrageenanivorans TaxID=2979869 RepID=A0ABY6D3K8_9BACT|nr:hypothetical protein [Reichenbachiella carrageenanivorans]UXX78425.1 hypothetical protein N7E81_13770 [Reichenbachiella carrageenanivorans]